MSAALGASDIQFLDEAVRLSDPEWVVLSTVSRAEVCCETDPLTSRLLALFYVSRSQRLPLSCAVARRLHQRGWIAFATEGAAGSAGRVSLTEQGARALEASCAVRGVDTEGRWSRGRQELSGGQR